MSRVHHLLVNGELHSGKWSQDARMRDVADKYRLNRDSLKDGGGLEIDKNVSLAQEVGDTSLECPYVVTGEPTDADVTAAQEVQTALRVLISKQEEFTRAQQESVSKQEEVTRAQQESISKQEEVTRAQQESISKQEEVTRAQQESISKQEELLSQQDMIWQLFAETGLPMLLNGFIAAESRSTHSDFDHRSAALDKWAENFEGEAVCACSGLPVKGSCNPHGVKFGYCHRFPQAKRVVFEKYTGLLASDFDGHKNAFFLLKDIEYYLDRGWILILFGIEQSLKDTFYLSLNQWPSGDDVRASKKHPAPALDDPICVTGNQMRWHEWKVPPPAGVNLDDIIRWRHLHNFPLTHWPVSKMDNVPAPLSRRVCAVVAAAQIQLARLGGLGPHAQAKALAGPSPREVLEDMCTPGAARGRMSSVLERYFVRAEAPNGQMGPMDEAVVEDTEDMDGEVSLSAACVSGLALVDGDDRTGQRS